VEVVKGWDPVVGLVEVPAVVRVECRPAVVLEVDRVVEVRVRAVLRAARSSRKNRRCG